MSKGMWTKQYTVDGKIFYYNSTQNKSIWHPPIGSEIHEAANLLYPQNYPVQSMYPSNYQPSYQNNFNPSNSLITQYCIESNETQNNQISHELLNYNSVSNAQLPVEPSLSIQQKIDDALNRKHKELLAKKQSLSKVVTQDSCDISAGSNPTSSYLKQKTELEQMAGCKGSDTSKWLVR